MSSCQGNDSDRLRGARSRLKKRAGQHHKLAFRESQQLASDLDLLIAVYDAQEQQLRAWQDHLVRVHRVACDYPFRTELPEDYDG